MTKKQKIQTHNPTKGSKSSYTTSNFSQIIYKTIASFWGIIVISIINITLKSLPTVAYTQCLQRSIQTFNVIEICAFILANLVTFTQRDIDFIFYIKSFTIVESVWYTFFITNPNDINMYKMITAFITNLTVLFIDQFVQHVGLSKRTNTLHSSLGLSNIFLNIYTIYKEKPDHFSLNTFFLKDCSFSILYLLCYTLTYCYFAFLYYPVKLYHTNSKLLNPKIELPVRIFNRMETLVILLGSFFTDNLIISLSIIATVFIIFILFKRITGAESNIKNLIYRFSLYSPGNKPGYETTNRIAAIEEGCLFLELCYLSMRTLVLYGLIYLSQQYFESYNLILLNSLIQQRSMNSILSCYFDLTVSIFDYYFFIN